MAPIKRATTAIIMVSCHLLTARVSTQQTGLYKIQSPPPGHNIFAFGYFPQTSTPHKRVNSKAFLSLFEEQRQHILVNGI